MCRAPPAKILHKPKPMPAPGHDRQPAAAAAAAVGSILAGGAPVTRAYLGRRPHGRRSDQKPVGGWGGQVNKEQRREWGRQRGVEIL